MSSAFTSSNLVAQALAICSNLAIVLAVSDTAVGQDV